MPRLRFTWGRNRDATSIDITVDFPADAAGNWTVVASAPTMVTGNFALQVQLNPTVPLGLIQLTYAYYADGSVKTVTDNDGGQNAYQYDPLSRLTEVKQSGDSSTAKQADFTYYDDSQANTVTRSVGSTPAEVATGTSTYDSMGCLAGLVHTKGTTTITGYDFNYDDAGNMTVMTSTRDGTTSYTGYDATNQLTAVDQPSGQTDESFTYDANGNRMTSGSTQWSTNHNQLQFDGTYHFAYDNEGNRTFQFVSADGALGSGDTDITKYTWDYRNRLTAVRHYTSYTNYQADTPDQVVAYTYDYAGRQIRRALTTGGSTSYAYDVFVGNDLYLEVTDPNHLSTGGASAYLSHRYLYDGGGQGLAIDNCSGVVLWGLGDNVGTVRDVVGSSGTVQDHRTYTSFGTMSPSNPAVDYPFGFEGAFWDKAAQLDRNGARLYDPSAGVWISADPSGFASGDPNFYRYCGNNPVIGRDPLGLQTEYSGSGSTAGSGGSPSNFSSLLNGYYAANPDDAPISIQDGLRQQREQQYFSSQPCAACHQPGQLFAFSTLQNVSRLSAGQRLAVGTWMGGASNAQIQSEGDAAAFTTGGIYGGAAVAAAGIGFWALGPAAPYVASFLIGYAGTQSVLTRAADPDQSTGQVMAGGVLDTFGVSGIWGSAKNTDIMTQKDLGLSPFDRAFNLPISIAQAYGMSRLTINGGAKLLDWTTSPRGTAPAPPDDGPVFGPYGTLRNSPISGQAHHLNQNSVFNSVIPVNQGVSTKLVGDAFNQPGTPHFEAHDTMEGFWDMYRAASPTRPQGMLFDETPTNSQYNRALYNSLQESGWTPQQAIQAVRQAKAQQLQYGLRGWQPVPNKPNPTNQTGGRPKW
jgi:RHS repeat-associated protein